MSAVADTPQTRLAQLFDDDNFAATPKAMANALRAVLSRHQPWHLYDECGHQHDADDPDAVDIGNLGYVCKDGHMYDLCIECCTEGGDGEYQRLWCLENHHHSVASAWCLTVLDIARELGLTDPGSERIAVAS